MHALLAVLILSWAALAQSNHQQALLGIAGAPSTPTDSPGAGSYGSTQSVTLSSTASQFINYTTDGSTPVCPSTGTVYSGAISIAATTTVKAIGCNGVVGSGVLTSVYTISGGSPITMTAHKIVQATSAGGSATTATMNCTGANWLWAFTLDYSPGFSSVTVDDSTGANTSKWANASNKTTELVSGTERLQLWSVPNASVNSSMTVTATGNYAVLAAGCGTNGNTSLLVDQQNGAGTAGAPGTQQPGSVTPTSNNQIVITCFGAFSTTGTMTNYPPSGYTALDQLAGSGLNSQFAACAYVIQTAATATNPTWDTSGLAGLVGVAAVIVSLTQ